MEVQRLTGRDTTSWTNRLVSYAEANGLIGGLVRDSMQDTSSFRLWPQLERLRTLSCMPNHGIDLENFLERLIELFLSPCGEGGWVDQLDRNHQPSARTIPASMLYHFMTVIAPLAEPYNGETSSLDSTFSVCGSR